MSNKDLLVYIFSVRHWKEYDIVTENMLTRNPKRSLDLLLVTLRKKEPLKGSEKNFDYSIQQHQYTEHKSITRASNCRDDLTN